VVKPDNEERRVAVFKDNKLRLLMVLVGFSRLGADNDPDATWVIPSSLTAAELSEAIDLIRKFEFDPPVYDDGKTAEDFLRSKAASIRRSARKAEFDDDSDGIVNDSEEDRGEYAADGPTARKSDGRKILKRRRRERTPREIDDEEREAKAEARRQKELEKQRKVKSTMFIHESDDEDWDEERDKTFFDQEQALRDLTITTFKQSLALGSTELASSKKRKADEQPKKTTKRQRTPPKRKAGPFDTDSEDDDDEGINISSKASSPALSTDSEDEATDTPLSSQHAALHASDDEVAAGAIVTAAKSQDVVMADTNADEDEDEVAPKARRPAVRNMRAGFVIDSDSE
jgi:replication fork protection complex subunit Tof1/Swi1